MLVSVSWAVRLVGVQYVHTGCYSRLGSRLLAGMITVASCISLAQILEPRGQLWIGG